MQCYRMQNILIWIHTYLRQKLLDICIHLDEVYGDGDIPATGKRFMAGQDKWVGHISGQN